MKKIVLMSVLLWSASLYAQTENCGNGIDDDGDGLVDCNDPDCGTFNPDFSLFNTGSDGNGGTQPSGSLDLRWTISTGGLNGTYVPATVLGPPVTNPYTAGLGPDAEWISGNVDAFEDPAAEDPLGGRFIYHYRITFNLPCLDGCGGDVSDNFCLKMDFFADNAIMAVFVNGVQQPATANMNPPFPEGFYGFHTVNAATIELCDDWQPGTNTLTVRTLSGGGLQGFLAQMNSTFDPPAQGHPPTADLDSLFYICGAQNVNLYATGYDPTDTLTWSTGSHDDTITVNTTGHYWLRVANACGADTFYTQVVPVVPYAEMDSLHHICGSQTIQLYATGYAATDSLLWNTGHTGDTLTVTEPGTYTLTLTNVCGSTVLQTKVIEPPPVSAGVLPNVFTPDGDGINDVYILPDVFSYAESFNTKIYNRWGAKVYDTDDKKINWSPKNISDGVYFMTIFYMGCDNQKEEKVAQTITVFSK